MRALWSDRPNCSHNVSQKVKRIRRVSEFQSGTRREVHGPCTANKSYEVQAKEHTSSGQPERRMIVPCHDVATQHSSSVTHRTCRQRGTEIALAVGEGRQMKKANASMEIFRKHVLKQWAISPISSHSPEQGLRNTMLLIPAASQNCLEKISVVWKAGLMSQTSTLGTATSNQGDLRHCQKHTHTIIITSKKMQMCR